MKTSLRRILVFLSSHSQFLALPWLAWALVVLLAYYAKTWFPGKVGSTGWEPYAFKTVIKEFFVVLIGAGSVLLVIESLGIHGVNRARRLLTGQRRILLCSIVTAAIGLVVVAGAYYAKSWQFPGAGFGTRYFPALGEASYRIALGILGAGQVILAACFLGFCICRLLKWKPESTSEALLYYTALGFGGIAYLAYGLASLGQYYRGSLAVLVMGLIICGTLWFCWRRMRGEKRSKEMLATTQTGGNADLWDRLWRFVALVAVLMAFIGALAPETEYDALWFHLGLPKYWLDQGWMVDVVSEYVSLYPMQWELIFGAGLALGGPVAAKLLHFSCLLFTALLVYQLAKRYLFEVSPWLAVAFFVTIPVVLWEGTTAYIDLALTLHVGLTLYALLRYVEGERWQWLGLAIINSGLALSTKHLAWFVLILATVGLVFRLWIKNHNLRSILFPSMAFVFLSLLLPLPWYIRSWQACGNPFFPELFGIFGAQPTGRWDVISEQGLRHFFAGFGRSRTVLNLLSLPWDMTIHAARYGGTLGPLFLLLLPSLLLFRCSAHNITWFVSFVLLYLALWASPISSFQMRFLLPITPFLAVLAAEASKRLTLTLRGMGMRRGRFFLFSALTILFLLNLPPFLPLHEVDREGWKGWLTHVIRTLPVRIVSGRESHEDYLTRSVPSYASWRYINTHVPKNACILTFSGGDNYYSERRRIWSDATLARPATWGASLGEEREALQALADLGISHVLFDKRLLRDLPPGNFAIAQSSILNTWYEREYEDRGFVLYRVRWDWMTHQPEIQR